MVYIHTRGSNCENFLNSRLRIDLVLRRNRKNDAILNPVITIKWIRQFFKINIENAGR